MPFCGLGTVIVVFEIFRVFFRPFPIAVCLSFFLGRTLFLLELDFAVLLSSRCALTAAVDHTMRYDNSRQMPVLVIAYQNKYVRRYRQGT